LHSTVHATCVLLGERAVLIRGPSGAGKSDLAFRLISSPAPTFAPAASRAMLVADDRVHLRAKAMRLMASPPDEIAGKLEVRGIGVIETPYRQRAEVFLLVDLMRFEDVERMPPSPLPSEEVHGVILPRLPLDPFEASALQKLWLAVYHHTANNLA